MHCRQQQLQQHQCSSCQQPRRRTLQPPPAASPTSPWLWPQLRRSRWRQLVPAPCPGSPPGRQTLSASPPQTARKLLPSRLRQVSRAADTLLRLQLLGEASWARQQGRCLCPGLQRTATLPAGRLCTLCTSRTGPRLLRLTGRRPGCLARNRAPAPGTTSLLRSVKQALCPQDPPSSGLQLQLYGLHAHLAPDSQPTAISDAIVLLCSRAG